MSCSVCFYRICVVICVSRFDCPGCLRVLFSGSTMAVPASERELYAQVSSSEMPRDSTTRRRYVFPSVDKAYRDNELLVPISGFLSEHGQLYQRDTATMSSPTSKEKKGNFPLPKFKQLRAKSSSSSHTHGSQSVDSNHVENLLDLREVSGVFSASSVFAQCAFPDRQ